MKLFFTTFLCCGLVWSAAAKNVSGPRVEPMAYAPRAEQVLNEVWNEICKRNYDQNLDRKFHDRVFKYYLPEARKCTSDVQLAALLNKMAAEIGQSHIGVIPPSSSEFKRAVSKSRETQKTEKKTKPEAAEKVKTDSGKINETDAEKPEPDRTAADNTDQPADVGLKPCVIGNKMYVLRLRPGFPAEQAGIKPGDQIISINGTKMRPELTADFPWTKLADVMLAGNPGSKVKLETVSGSGKPQTVVLIKRPNGCKWFKFGVMPRTFSDFEEKILPGNIGYIAFTAFFPEQISNVQNAVKGNLKNTDGLIIDLRDNIGGLLVATQWLAGWLTVKRVASGTLIISGTKLKPVSYPQPECYKKPLAILVNAGSFSCAELFPAAMQDAKAATIFGQRTMGKCLPSTFFILPSGFKLQTVHGDHIRANGERVEGKGVTPDIPVELKLDDLKKGQDTVIDAARKYLINLKKSQ